MGLDVGNKTIGVALSDPMFLLANGLETIKRKKCQFRYRKTKRNNQW